MIAGRRIVGDMKFALSICAICMAVPAMADPVVVFAAASLKEPIDKIAAQMDDVVVSYGGSGALARQVMQGAPADVVLLANADWMDTLIDAGLARAESNFASNELVLIGVTGTPQMSLAEWAKTIGARKVAMGFTNAVPAGIYGKAALTNLDLWNGISGNVVAVDSARAVLALVARGEVAFGVTYVTDAWTSDKVQIVATFAPETHPKIRYVGAITNAAGHAFWDLTRGSVGQSILADAGFLPAAVR